MPTILTLLAAAAQAAAQPGPVEVPQQPILTREITARDAELFELFFSGPCDATRLRSLIADDIEFYHDKAGFNARSAEDFIAIFASNCAARAAPAGWRTRRELVPESLHVDPVPGWGAIQGGEHLFFERQGEKGPEKLGGRARFAQLWVLDAGGRWRLSRVFSYAHSSAQ